MAGNVRLNHAGMAALLHSPGVRADLSARAERVAEAARSAAPVDTGAYKASIRVLIEDHPTRVAAHVSAGVRYAHLVESRLGVLARALDAAR